MDATLIARYRAYRAEHPFLAAQSALDWVRTPDASVMWEEDSHGHNSWTRVANVDDFEVRLHVSDGSIFPIPDKHGSTDFGRYVAEAGRYAEDYDWGGNWPRPLETAPLGIPYTSIRYSGPGWVQGEKGGYFIPDNIEEDFADYRRRGQSKSVAWDLTKANVEAQISMLFHSPLCNVDVTVSVHRNGIDLGSATMGTDVSGDNEGRAYIFQMVEEYGMVEEAIAEGKAAVASLCL